ncbi:MAG: AMP-binding protein, partial [Proteobacteria bacterium]|nr:AMP-binding protein [Pseudomonadota bacterium]
HTAPTVIRALRKIGPDEPAKYNYHFKHMTTVGEPIEPEVWKWFYKVIGKGEAVVVDTWWQTETGGFLCGTVPALKPMKPGSTGPGVSGIHPIIYDELGNEIKAGEGRAGNICIRNPWPGAFQTIWRDRDRYVSTYYAKYCKDKNSKDWRDWPYLTGDAAMEAEDGYYRILGRIDDVINVSGHRLGTKEIESASFLVQEVAEAAVVPVADEIKGVVPDLYISLKPGYEPTDELAAKISAAICDTIGKIARPRKIWLVSDMPKTRSGKIMRRVLGAISNKKDVGDVSTLANPEIVDEIKKKVTS